MSNIISSPRSRRPTSRFMEKPKPLRCETERCQIIWTKPSLYESFVESCVNETLWNDNSSADSDFELSDVSVSSSDSCSLPEIDPFELDSDTDFDDDDTAQKTVEVQADVHSSDDVDTAHKPSVAYKPSITSTGPTIQLLPHDTSLPSTSQIIVLPHDTSLPSTSK